MFSFFTPTCVFQLRILSINFLYHLWYQWQFGTVYNSSINTQLLFANTKNNIAVIKSYMVLIWKDQKNVDNQLWLTHITDLTKETIYYFKWELLCIQNRIKNKPFFGYNFFPSKAICRKLFFQLCYSNFIKLEWKTISIANLRISLVAFKISSDS